MSNLKFTRQDLMRELVVGHNIRSVADYSEQIVAEALNGERILKGARKGHDVVAPQYGRIEVKFRQLPADGRLEERVALSDAKQNGFDYLAVVVFQPDFTVKGAVLVPYAAAWECVTQSAYSRISYSYACGCEGAIDITEKVATAARR
jgi:hypothetical protein